MPRVRSDSEKKPNGEWNISTCLRNILKEHGVDASVDVVREALSEKTGGKIKEVPAFLYTIRKQVKEESGGKKSTPAKGGKGGKKEAAGKLKKAVEELAIAAKPTNNGHVDSSVVKAVTLTQEAMEACGGRQALLDLIDRLTVTK